MYTVNLKCCINLAARVEGVQNMVLGVGLIKSRKIGIAGHSIHERKKKSIQNFGSKSEGK
jgi:hypothetical protein